jgi:lactate permease
MTWTQVYNPLGNLILSALVAAVPVVILLVLLAFLHVKAHIAAIAGLATSIVVAILVYGMPTSLAVASALNGAAFGLFPIGWIVLCAIFIYDITVATGKFEIVKETIAGLANDRRIQALLIAFSFGAFIEGAAGFGTPVAISAAMLIGLGFKPLEAAGIALIGNTAPVAYGALGTPIIALARVTGLPLEQLSAMVGRQLPFFSMIVPFWLVWAMAGWKGMREVWPACLVSGLSFAIVQFLVSNYHGPCRRHRRCTRLDPLTCRNAEILAATLSLALRA